MLPGKLSLGRCGSKVKFEYVLPKLGQKRRKQGKFSDCGYNIYFFTHFQYFGNHFFTLIVGSYCVFLYKSIKQLQKEFS